MPNEVEEMKTTILKTKGKTMGILLIEVLILFSTLIVFTGTVAASEWISPTGSNDPYQWTSEYKAFDDDLSKYAYWSCSGSYPTYWGSYLELTHSAIQCDKIRYYISYVSSSYINRIDVDVYKDGTWVDVYAGAFTTGSWIEHSFTEGSVTKARIRFGSCYGKAYCYSGKLAEFDFGKVESTPSSEIPEFTTVALPVAGILGLFLFFNHRKQKQA